MISWTHGSSLIDARVSNCSCSFFHATIDTRSRYITIWPKCNIISNPIQFPLYSKDIERVKFEIGTELKQLFGEAA